MKWFKMLWLTSEERKILKEAKEKQEKDNREGDSGYTPPSTSTTEQSTIPPRHIMDYGLMEPKAPDRPYKNILYCDGHITVVFANGDVICKTGVDNSLFQDVKSAKTQSEIEDLLVDQVYTSHDEQEIDTEYDRRLIMNSLDVIRDSGDFTIKGNTVTMKGVNLDIPAPVIASFIEILEKLECSMDEEERKELQDSYTALTMFWLKLALNPLAQSREDLLLFVRKNDVRITRNGNLILYRRIVSKGGTDKALLSFVSQTYYSIKKSGRDPREYAVGKGEKGYYVVSLNDEYKFNSELIGNLQVMYLELPTFKENDYGAWYAMNTSIKIGGIYSIPDNKINLNNGICAAGGLHAASVDYNYSGYGDTPVVVLVNPSKAITVPLGDVGKLRTTEMFVACINDKPQGIHFDDNGLSAFDEEYHDFTLEELEDAARNKTFYGLSVQDNVPSVSLVDLDQIRNLLKNRVKHIV
jgi:hypothetical protein